MTDMIAPDQELRYRDVETFWKKLNKVAETAAVVRRNFEWLTVNDGRMIPLLDTDIIYGSILGAAVTATTFDYADQKQHTSPMQQPFGPHQLRRYLKSVRRVSLPPGTVAELITKQSHIKGQISSNARKVLDMVRALERHENISQELPGGSKETVGSAIREALADFVTGIDSNQLLEQLLQSNEPPEDLFDRRPDRDAAETFRTVLRRLNLLRPTLDVSNYHDAINAATVVRLFNSESGRASYRHVPVLVSGTVDVIKSADILDRHLRSPGVDNPRVVADKSFLNIYGALMEYTQGDRFQVGADKARQLYDDCDDLSYYCRHLLEDTQRSLSHNDYHEKSHLIYCFEMIQNKSRQFFRSWEALLWPANRDVEYDSLAWINRLISPYVEQSLASGDKVQVRKTASRLINDLRQARFRDRDLWAQLRDFSVLTITGSMVASNIIPAEIVYMYVENDGAPLSDISTGLPFKMFTSDVAKSEHSSRIVAFHPYARPGVFLAAESLRVAQKSPRRIGLIWLHSCDVEAIWTHLWQLVLALQAVIGPAPAVQMRVTSPASDSYVVIESEGTVPELHELARVPGASFIELNCGDAVVFADIQPLEEVELQMGLYIPDKLWKAQLSEQISSTVFETSGFLNGKVLLAIVHKLMACIEAGGI